MDISLRDVSKVVVEHAFETDRCNMRTIIIHRADGSKVVIDLYGDAPIKLEVE